MKNEEKIKFSQNWIEDAVKKLLQKEDLSRRDIEKIKYLRIGEDFNNGYMIQISTAIPPEPFCDTDGGDEWEPGGNGAVVTGRFIQYYIDYVKDNPFDYTDPDTGEHSFQLSQFAFWQKFKKVYEELETETDGACWEEAVKNWKSFEKTILCETYRKKFDREDTWDAWYQQTGRTIQQDIGLFTGLEVLRMQGAEYQDMTFLRTMPLLRVWEVVETDFSSLEGIDDLVRLKQLCCWLD